MRVTFENAKEAVRQIYVHDSTVSSFTWIENEHSVKLILKNLYSSKRFSFAFAGVKYVEVVSLDVWIAGCSEIYGLELESEEKCIEKMRTIEIQKDVESANVFQALDMRKLLCCVITFMSGNTLRIICDEIEYHEDSVNSAEI